MAFPRAWDPFPEGHAQLGKACAGPVIHSLTQSFKIILLSTYYVLGPVHTAGPE